MQLIKIIDGFQPKNDERLLRRAEELTPALLRDEVSPVSALFFPSPDSEAHQSLSPAALSELPLSRGQRVVLDFGTHLVGYLSLSLGSAGSHPDAPAYLSLRFAEVWDELWENPEEYTGWLARGWIQRSSIHVDMLPEEVSLPRRCAFRYLMLTVEDTSPKYRLVVRDVRCSRVGAVRLSDAPPLKGGDEVAKRLDEVSLRTLANCMQQVFEDGPKRDQRLWMGDLRLQALSNYVSFRCDNLVKRCLYLFAGSRFPDGRVSACVFTRPEPAADDTWLFDYSLFFVHALEEYLQQTDDREALDDLYATAMEQLDYALALCGEDGILTSPAANSAFIDWADGLNRLACAEGVLIDALGAGECLAWRRGDGSREALLHRERCRLTAAARERFWDAGGRCFCVDGQRAIATQVWMVLSRVATPEEAVEIMSRPLEAWDNVPMVTPYMHHYYVMALLQAGLRDAALAHMNAYWGSMLDAGADTFWEAWNPDDPKGSPYGSVMVNSYCHAWSCTPAYLLRTFFVKQ